MFGFPIILEAGGRLEMGVWGAKPPNRGLRTLKKITMEILSMYSMAHICKIHTTKHTLDITKHTINTTKRNSGELLVCCVSTRTGGRDTA